MIERHAPVTSVQPGSPQVQEQPPRIVQPRLDSQATAPLPPTAPRAAVLPERTRPLPSATPRLPDIPPVVVTVPLNDQAEVPQRMIRERIPPPAAIAPQPQSPEHIPPTSQPPATREVPGREPIGTPPETEKVIVVASSGNDGGTPAAGKPVDSSAPHIQVGESQPGVHAHEDTSPSGTEKGKGPEVGVEKVVVTREELPSTAPADTGGSGKGGDKNIPRPPGGNEGPDDSEKHTPSGGKGEQPDPETPPNRWGPPGKRSEEVRRIFNAFMLNPSAAAALRVAEDYFRVLIREMQKPREERHLPELPPELDHPDLTKKSVYFGYSSPLARLRSALERQLATPPTPPPIPEPLPLPPLDKNLLSIAETLSKREALEARLLQKGVPKEDLQTMAYTTAIALEFGLQIANGERQKGTSLPIANEIAAMYSISYSSARIVAKILREKGLVKNERNRNVVAIDSSEYPSSLSWVHQRKISPQGQKVVDYIAAQSPGTLLPPIYELAEQLGISVPSLLTAYKRLQQEGSIYLRTDHRRIVLPESPKDHFLNTLSETQRRVFEHLSRSRDLTEGEKLPRREEVARTLGVNPLSVYYAYHHLVQLGLAKVVPNNGFYAIEKTRNLKQYFPVTEAEGNEE